MASSLSLIIVGILIGYLCYLQVQIIKHTKNKNEKNYCKILLVLYIICNIYFFIIVDFRFPLDTILILGYIIMIGFFYGFHLVIKYIFHVNTIMTDIDIQFQDTKKNLHEFLRKFFHFFVFGGSLLFIFLYNLITMEILRQNPTFGILALLNIDFIYDPDLNHPRIMELAMMTFFMIALPFAIIVERFRLDPEKEIPFHSLFVKSLRPSEQHNAAHYYFFIFGIFISAIFLPVACVFAILCLLCFGDTFASLIGKKFGKHKIKWEQEKSWEGTFAGFIFTVITAYFFVGWILSITLGIIFISIDVVTPEKIKISDNFLYPLISIVILGSLVYLIGIQIDAPLANIFEVINEFYLNFSS